MYIGTKKLKIKFVEERNLVYNALKLVKFKVQNKVFM